MSFRDNGIVILLGAGASKDANIPTSMDMIKDIEKWIFDGKRVDGTEWGEFRDLYCCIRSAIYYSDGIHGKFDGKVNYNIEKLVNTLRELEERENHAIYPFVGGWNIKLVEVAGASFTNIKKFREAIVDQLKAWVTISNYDAADYYKKLFTFQDEYGFPLRVFTLNYDLCVEKHRNSAVLERGFDENRRWEWRRFEYNENIPVDIYLYKMHGSIDWERDGDSNLTWSDEIAKVAVSDLIFGTNYKLQYVDPYLFFAYEFRRHTLDSQLILTIGYGFGDDHINGIIGQAPE